MKSGKYNIDAHSIAAMGYGLEEFEYTPLKKRLKTFYGTRRG